MTKEKIERQTASCLGHYRASWTQWLFARLQARLAAIIASNICVTGGSVENKARKQETAKSSKQAPQKRAESQPSDSRSVGQRRDIASTTSGF